jgi:hypothetical protein
MLLQFNQIKNKWTLHIQDMSVSFPPVTEAKQIMLYKLAGEQRIYELEN